MFILYDASGGILNPWELTVNGEHIMDVSLFIKGVNFTLVIVCHNYIIKL